MQTEGAEDGSNEGNGIGAPVGSPVGVIDGPFEGSLDDVGAIEGKSVGFEDGKMFPFTTRSLQEQQTSFGSGTLFSHSVISHAVFALSRVHVKVHTVSLEPFGSLLSQT